MSAGEVTALVLAALAVWLRGLFAAAEAAFAAVGRREAEEMVEEELPGARRVLALDARRDELHTALRAAQLLALSVAAACGAYFALWGVAPRVPWHRVAIAPWGGGLVAVLVGALVAAGIAFLFGDLVPRAFAAASAGQWARRLSIPARFALFAARPFVGLARLLADVLLRPFGRSTRRLRGPPPLEELERHLEAHAASGAVSAQTPELIGRVFEFGETTAKEVMVPRTQVEALEIGASSGEILSTIAGKGHTRLPVYRDEIDNIVGIINAKDIIPLVERGAPIELLKIMRPVTFVPWSKPISELMRELQAKHVHMAMVVDEFGGFMGLITLEDILEEIVGEIEDEFDRPETHDVEALPDGSFLVRASMDVEEFNRAFSASVPEDEDYETLAGFLNALAGAIPAQGDTFFHEGLQLVVAKRSERRVRQVRVRRIRPAPPGPAPDEEAERGRS